MENNNNIKKSESFSYTKVSSIALVHFIHDLYTSTFAPILPILIKSYGFSLFEGGTLSLFIRLPHIFNPFFGRIIDGRELYKVILIITPATTAIFMSLIGIANGYAALAVLLTLTGISVALLHISAPVLVRQYSANALGRGMSFFMIGGETARTVGPVIAVWAVSTLGLRGIWPLMIVGIAASFMIWFQLARQKKTKIKTTKKFVSFMQMLGSMRGIFSAAFGIMTARAFMHVCISTYLPTYLYNNGSSLWLSGISLSVFEFAGIFGVMISGPLSDKIGRKKILLMSVGLGPALLLAFIYSNLVFKFIVLLALGFTILATGPVLMALILENAGDNPAAANGIYMMTNFTVRAGVVMIIGYLSDVLGMTNAYIICALIGFLGLPFVFLVKDNTTLKAPQM